MQSMRDQLMAYAVAKRDELLTGADNGADDDLAPEERPNRAELGPVPGCLIKPFDELEVYNSVPLLYLCPGRGIGQMYVLQLEGNVISLTQFLTTDVTDRLPADPLETPMPIFPAPEP